MTNSRDAADDLRAKIHEMFAQVMGNLDPQLDRLIKSGCGIIEDHEKNGMDSWATAKQFLIAFLESEAESYAPPVHSKNKWAKQARNYSKFL